MILPGWNGHSLPQRRSVKEGAPLTLARPFFVCLAQAVARPSRGDRLIIAE